MPSFIVLSFFSSWLSFVGWLTQPFREGHPVFTYHLDKPDHILDLADEIKEISGLSFTADFKTLAAVNDEAGIVFLLDKKSGEIVSRIPFRESGDFEGVEIVGEDAWVVKSNGSLYQIKNFAQQNPVVEKYKSFLNSEHDVEGIAYDPIHQRLLLGCKGKGVEGLDKPLNKAIYAFDLSTKTVSETPAFLLTLPDLQDFLKKSGEDEADKKLERIFSPEDAQMKFSPSGIAIHPKTGEIYITSARGNTLLVLDANGKILHLERLKKSTHAQPEGICFDTDGTLYIANEGADGGAGKIYAFYQKG
ncbi:MAG: SdiA-regulated domain-containing protein [Saprospiraceae bacterium]|jgi:uncharacterized protein YjiK|nr:SdiA-regulated domain-containing protein [Saprospiraceae bacterium]